MSKSLFHPIGPFGIRIRGILGVIAAAALLLGTPAQAKSPSRREKPAGPTAPDFPPGTFSDGGHYSLSDFQGKALVLFFYEKECPTCRGLIPERNKVVEQFKGQPIKFIAVGPNDSLTDVLGYMRSTHLDMITFADTLGAMEARYGFHISLQNIYQFRYIGPKGDVVMSDIEFTPAKVEKLLKGVKWKYKDGGYDPRLNFAINLLEWNQYEAGLRALRPYLKRKATAESAQKLYDAVKAEGSQWLDQAVAAQSSNPVRAYDLYSKVSACFPGEEMAKTAADALKTLAKDAAVVDELAARQQYARLYSAMTRASVNQRAQVRAFCLQLSEKYPQTPTGQKAAELAKDLAIASAQPAAE